MQEQKGRYDKLIIIFKWQIKFYEISSKYSKLNAKNKSDIKSDNNQFQ